MIHWVRIVSLFMIEKIRTHLAHITLVTGLALTLLGYFSFGLYHLTKYATTDEQFWLYNRIPDYWKALADGKLANTHINDKPGVTLAFTSGLGLLLEPHPENHKISGSDLYDQYFTRYTEKLYFLFRFPLLFINGLFLFYLFWVVRKLTNNPIALWTTILTGLSPVLLGMSRIINPDALLWSTGAGALFSYLAFLKTDEKKLFWLAGVFTGLALLTKYVATVLFLFYVVSFLGYGLVLYRENSGAFLQYLKKHALAVLGVYGVSLAVLAVLMPAALVKPKFLYEATIGFESFRPFALPLLALLAWIVADIQYKGGLVTRRVMGFCHRYQSPLFRAVLALFFAIVLLTGINWMTGESLFTLSQVPVDARSSDVFLTQTNLWQKIFLEAYPLVFSVTPVVLLLTLAYLIKALFLTEGKLGRHLLPVLLSLFVLIFWAGGIFSGVLLTTRYMIMLYPIMALLAAFGLYSLTPRFMEDPRVIAALSAALILCGVSSLWLSKPFYYNYASALLPERYIVSSTWGFGGYEAAQYLNALPHADKLTVWSDYRGVCEFFVGKCIITRDYNVGDYQVDYYVLSRRGQARLDDRILNSLEDKNIISVWKLFVGGRPENFVAIYKANE